MKMVENQMPVVSSSESVEDAIYSRLRQEIQSGLYPVSSYLPSLRHIAGKYDTNIGVVRQSFLRLQHEGIIRPEAGKGYCVIAPPVVQEEEYLYIGPVSGHLFGDMFAMLQNSEQLKENSIHLRILDPDGMSEEDARSYAEKIPENVTKVIFNGLHPFGTNNFSFLAERFPFYRFLGTDRLPELQCPAVLSDWFHGGYIGMRHLIEIGRKNILIVSVEPEHKTTVPVDFEEGCRKAIDESAGDVKFTIFRESRTRRFTPPYNKELTESIDAVFSICDYSLLPYAGWLHKRGCSIPEDVALLGYNNTPWCDCIYPQLSSISVNPQQIINRIVDMATRGEAPVRPEIVRPELIIRESTGGRTEFMNTVVSACHQIAFTD